MSDQVKYLLDESRIPKRWYNIQADLPKALPAVLHPGTLQPVGPDDLAPLFPMELIMQEVSTEREIDIPEPVRDIFRLWRPTPMYRARALEKALGTPARIFYKYEGVSPAGSHKPNTAIAQAFYNKQAVIAQQKAQQQQMALDRLADAIKQLNAKYAADCGGKVCRLPKRLAG